MLRATGFLLIAASAFAAGPVSFNRDVRPIMSGTCFRCHGPDRSSRMVGLRLDLRDEALKARANGTPIVPGDPEHSLMIQRIFATTPGRQMPPPSAHKELTAAQKDTLRRWVAEGAPYEGHWAYQALKQPAPPALSGPTVRNPIDAFIQARLAAENLKPSPEADRRTLIRRVSLDLTGLLPTTQEIDDFVKDRSPDAYEKVVDRLLASPRYAEQQTMHWLDYVRYADTCGFHGDNPLPAWPYRDYVLRSFRDNKPFDQFTREQLAGDLIPDASIEQKVASAYNRLNRTSAEGGLQPKEYLAKYGADRVRTLSAVWLGSTLGCAECHDHKFDPFLSKDFYSMKAFFADIKETGLVPDKGLLAWGSQLALPTPEQAVHLEDLARRIDEARKKLEEKASELAAARRQWEQEVIARNDRGDITWHYQRPISAKANAAQLGIYNDRLLPEAELIVPGVILAAGPNPDTETYTVEFKPGRGSWSALGLEVRKNNNLPGTEAARGADRFVLSEIDAELATGSSPARKIPVAIATASVSADGFPALAAIDGDPRTGWSMDSYGFTNPFLVLRFPEEIVTGDDATIVVRLRQESTVRRATISQFRIALSAGDFTPPAAERRENATLDRRGGLPANVLAALKVAEEQRTPAQSKLVADYFESATPDLVPLRSDLAKLEAERSIADAAVPRVVVTEATTPTVTRILPRSNWMDETGAIVEPAIPEFLGKLDTGDRRATRLDLANWLVSADNPLTARVYVNRVWRQFFGAGISRVLEDMGSQGAWPSHPELLDWLAAEFAHGWDMKHVVRTIVTSYTYRQSSQSTPLLDERDPDNILLARQARFRVDAENVRDIAMQISGLLVEKFGGPSTKPYQPDGYLATLNFPKREYSASHGEDLYRRGVYTHWQRAFLQPSLFTFDAPTREECTINRVNSNTPLQALVLLNDPIYVEAARVFSANIVAQGGGSVGERLNWAFRRGTGRLPNTEERSVLSVLYQKELVRFRANPRAASDLLHTGEAPVPVASPELAAMTSVARVVLNLHEVITRD